MAKTRYLQSDKSILQKFVETLGKLFYDILPNKRQDSISANTLKSLYDFLNEHNEIKSEQKTVKESKFNNQENNKVIDDAMKLLENDKSTDTNNEQLSPVENLITTLKTQC